MLTLMPSRRAFVSRIVIALIVGVLIAVAISWCAMFLPRGNGWYGPLSDEELGLWKTDDGYTIFTITRGRNAWHTVVSYWWMQVSGQSLMIPIADYEARKFDFRELPAHFRPESLDDLYMQAWYHETGWPLGAMTCSVHWKEQISNADIIYRVRGGLQLPRDADFNPRALPLVPIWPGFVVNVLIWGGAWYLLAWSVRALRLRGRRRGNRCMRCGYSREGLAPDARCPECGAEPV